MNTNNLGKQYLTFDFKHPATAHDFNTLLRGAVKPGIYEGGNITSTGGSSVYIPPLIAYLNVGTDKLLRAITTETFTYTVNPSTPVLYMVYTWEEVVNNWVTFGQRAVGSVAITNEVCLGTCLFTTGVVTGFDYSNRDYGLYTVSDGVLHLQVATGTSPMQVNSTTKVNNLNVDKVDGADLSTDNTMAANSDILIPSQKATKKYAESVAVKYALIFG